MKFVLMPVLVICLLGWACHGISEPVTKEELKPAIILPAEVVEVVDGDTVDVVVRMRVRVRLLECWAPETRTKDLSEKARGEVSKNHLKDFAVGKSGILHVPIEEGNSFSDIFSFGRVLGYVQVDGKDLSLHQTSSKNATKTKEISE